MVLSFASCFNFGNKNNSEDDANKVTLYLDPNGGELPEGTSDEMQVVIGEKIGNGKNGGKHVRHHARRRPHVIAFVRKGG